MVELNVLPQTSSDALGRGKGCGGPGLSFTSSFWVSDCPGPTGLWTATPGMDEFPHSKMAIFGVYVNILGKMGKGELCQIFI